MRTIRVFFAAAMFAGLSLGANALVCSGTTITNPYTLTNSTNLDFGSIYVGSSGTITQSMSGNISTTGNIFRGPRATTPGWFTAALASNLVSQRSGVTQDITASVPATAQLVCDGTIGGTGFDVALSAGVTPSWGGSCANMTNSGGRTHTVTVYGTLTIPSIQSLQLFGSSSQTELRCWTGVALQVSAAPLYCGTACSGAVSSVTPGSTVVGAYIEFRIINALTARVTQNISFGRVFKPGNGSCTANAGTGNYATPSTCGRAPSDNEHGVVTVNAYSGARIAFTLNTVNTSLGAGKSPPAVTLSLDPAAAVTTKNCVADATGVCTQNVYATATLQSSTGSGTYNGTFTVAVDYY